MPRVIILPKLLSPWPITPIDSLCTQTEKKKTFLKVPFYLMDEVSLFFLESNYILTLIRFLAISTPAHQDSGFLTLLQTFGFSGLELQLDDVWYSVPCPKGMLVVNVGEQLAAMSNNRFKATIHRVLDIGQDRLKIHKPCCIHLWQSIFIAGSLTHFFTSLVWMPISISRFQSLFCGLAKMSMAWMRMKSSLMDHFC